MSTSIAGAASDAAPPEPNRPEAASTRCAFQAVIWFGCTSYCCANSASVFSPLIAASATLALKDGAWVRRVRLVMLAPDPRHPRRSQADFPLIGLSEFGRPSLMTEEDLERLKASFTKLAGRTPDSALLHEAAEDLETAEAEIQQAKAKVSTVAAKRP